MKYYTIEPACDTKETGHIFPQISEMTKGYDYDSVNSIYQLGELDKSPSFAPDLEHFVLNGKSKKSDLLSCSVIEINNWIISDTFLKLLLSFNLPRHKSLPLSIKQGKSHITNYSLFHFSPALFDSILFSESEFTIEEINTKNHIADIKGISKEKYFETKDDLFRKWENDEIEDYRAIFFKKMVLKEQPSFDLFYINNSVDTDVYISSNLAVALKENGITGLEIKETQKLVVNNSIGE